MSTTIAAASTALTKPHGLSDEYWGRISPEDRALYLLIRPMPAAAYRVDVSLGDLESFLARQQSDIEQMGGSFELEPDFQRGHVWSDFQRSRFVEEVLRSTAPTNIIFNCPGWGSNAAGDIPNLTFQCIDGLQRLTAVRMFMAGEFAVFDGRTAEDLKGTVFNPARRYRLQISVFEFSRRADLLQFYLDLNGGGTPHHPAEMDRVRALLAEAQGVRPDQLRPRSS